MNPVNLIHIYVPSTPAIIRPAPRAPVPPFYRHPSPAPRHIPPLLAGAFKPCTPCPYLYRRVYAWGGNFEFSGGGLWPGDKPDFITLYNSAIAQVNSIDISTVPWGQVRWFNYGGISGTKSDNTFVDSGNLLNDPANLPGSGLGHPPCGTDDFGAITAGGSEFSYMGNPGSSNPGLGINAGGYQYAIWGPSNSTFGSPDIGWFAISRIQVSLAAACNAKWSSVQWWPFGTPVPGGRNVDYFITCDTDATTHPAGSGATCENASITANSVCIDIPTSFPGAWGQTQPDPDLPCYSRYFVPGLNCPDLT